MKDQVWAMMSTSAITADPSAFERRMDAMKLFVFKPPSSPSVSLPFCSMMLSAGARRHTTTQMDEKKRSVVHCKGCLQGFLTILTIFIRGG